MMARAQSGKVAMAEPKDIRLVVGLGNPGAKYEKTRHNAGYATIDMLAKHAGVRYWKSQAGMMVAGVKIAGKDIYLARPQTYMNEAGGPISKLVRQLKISPEELLVVHDDVDVPDTKLRLKFGGGHDGHNGLRSIIQKMGSRDFCRLRFGVGRPPGRMSVAQYTLRPLKGTQLESFAIEAQDAADVVERTVAKGFAAEAARLR